MICSEVSEPLNIMAMAPGKRHPHETEPGNEEWTPEDGPDPIPPPQPDEDTPNNVP